MSMARRFLVVALLCAPCPAVAQPRPATELPVSRIVLFNSGVGYFQREGQVNGNARVDLKFPSDDINDLLKSMIVQDLNGGRITTVSYDNRDPIDRSLKSFAIDLSENPSLAKLLHQVRGERVAVNGQDVKGSAFNLEGSIVGVEREYKVEYKEQISHNEKLNLLTEQGLESRSLSSIQRIRFLNADLEREFQKALQILATGNDRQKKSVTLSFQGNGKRTVRVGYMTESPIWKSSYRLALDRDGNKEQAFLQGWAMVENTTDEDWNNVRLGLVSGRPISFQMDLYEPLFLQRPVVELELFSSLRPLVHSGSLGGVPAINPVGGQGAGDDEDRRNPLRKYVGLGGRMGAGAGIGGLGALGGLPGPGPGVKGPARDGESIDFRAGVASAAMASELGEYFKYEMEQPVSLARQKSSLVPIAQAPVEVSKISIYNAAVHQKYPLLGLRLKNTTGLHLMQGPVTVYESGVYAGDARLTDLQPNETRLISYAVDQGMEVVHESPKGAESLIAVKVVKGQMQTTYKMRYTSRYVIKNRSQHERTILVEHPFQADRTLIAPEKATERSREFYRFERTVKPNEQLVLDLVVDHPRIEQIAITNVPDQRIEFFIIQNTVSPAVQEAFRTALKLKSEWQAVQKEVQGENSAVKSIEQDQARMRANMERVPQTSEAYKRYLKKFDDQETEIEKRRAAINRLLDTSVRRGSAYESYLMNLNVE
jgi:hypothetical protein